MQVVDGLSAVFAAVHHHAIAIAQIELFCQIADDAPHVSDRRPVFVFDGIDRSNLLPRDHEDMHRSLRTDVMKRQAMIVLVNEFRWNLSVNDFLEDCLLGHDRLLPILRDSDGLQIHHFVEQHL